jgi:riboflavin kinase/FMN adenylyltransferase
MIIYNNLTKIKKIKKTVIAIGNFDGVHLGHQKVLRQASLKAKENKIKFGIVTFEPVPVMFFNKKIKNHRINSLKQKIDRFKKLKIDYLFIIKFNKKFSNLSYKQFIEKIIYKKFNSKYIFVSKNFRFGSNKVLSSSIIRSEIKKGNITKANKFLGRKWCVEGKVIKGQKRGRKIGFPTCNINLNNYVLPRLGVYAVKVMINKIIRKGIANVGYRPTFNQKTLLLEVNIFGLKSNLYNKIIKVSFLKFIRPEKKFKNVKQLIKQIKLDIKKSKK